MPLARQGPYGRAEDVTPSDTADIDPTDALYVGGAGNIKVDMLDGNTITIVAPDAGVILRLRVKRVYSTDTTATDIVALYGS